MSGLLPLKVQRCPHNFFFLLHNLVHANFARVQSDVLLSISSKTGYAYVFCFLIARTFAAAFYGGYPP